MFEPVGLAASLLTLSAFSKGLTSLSKDVYSAARHATKIGAEMRYFASIIGIAGDSFEITIMTLNQMPEVTNESDLGSYLHSHKTLLDINHNVEYLHDGFSEIYPFIEGMKSEGWVNQFIRRFRWLLKEQSRLTELIQKMQWLNSTISIILQIVTIKQNSIDKGNTRDPIFLKRLETDNRLHKRRLKMLEKQYAQQKRNIERLGSRKELPRKSVSAKYPDPLITLSSEVRDHEAVPASPSIRSRSRSSPSSRYAHSNPGSSSSFGGLSGPLSPYSSSQDPPSNARGLPVKKRTSALPHGDPESSSDSSREVPNSYFDNDESKSMGNKDSAKGEEYDSYGSDEITDNEDDPSSEAEGSSCEDDPSSAAEGSNCEDDPSSEEEGSSCEDASVNNNPAGKTILKRFEINLDNISDTGSAFVLNSITQKTLSVPGGTIPVREASCMSRKSARLFGLEVFKLENMGALTLEVYGEDFSIIGLTERARVRITRNGTRRWITMNFFVLDSSQREIIFMSRNISRGLTYPYE